MYKLENCVVKLYRLFIFCQCSFVSGHIFLYVYACVCMHLCVCMHVCVCVSVHACMHYEGNNLESSEDLLSGMHDHHHISL